MFKDGNLYFLGTWVYNRLQHNNTQSSGLRTVNHPYTTIRTLADLKKFIGNHPQLSQDEPAFKLGTLPAEADISESTTLQPLLKQYAMALSPQIQQLLSDPELHDKAGIYKQFIPSLQELEHTSEENSDPIGDNAFSPVKGIVHRYPDRVLFKPVHVCPVYCRFCFRREMVGPNSQSLSTAEIALAYDYIRNNTGIWEVIFTGGDPLILKPSQLKRLLQPLLDIEHVAVIRFHSRVPVVTPEAISTELVEALKSSGKTVYVVLHANHPSEFSHVAKQACQKIIDAGIPMLSQTVLLKGINDNVETLTALMRLFVANRIKPYYLHQGDLAPGTSHFRTTIQTGQQLMKALRGRISGLCQPEYVLDIPGGFGKIPLTPCYIKMLFEQIGDSTVYEVTDFNDNLHTYPPQVDVAGR